MEIPDGIMATRSRERRARRSEAREPLTSREPAIWRGGMTAASESERTAAPQVVNRRAFGHWRIFSGLIVASLLLVLALFFSSDAFFIRSIAVGGLRYLTESEIFALSGIANTHVFWIDPQEVRARILQSPTIANATVNVGWGTPMVQIVVEEREPALVLEQAGIATWVDLQGRVMRQREDRPDLLRVTNDNSLAGVPEGRVNTDMIAGALQLHSLMPEIPALRYNEEYGLGYNDPRGWEAWFGTGTNMPEKILIYNAIVDDLQRDSFVPTAVYVIDPDHPYYCCRVVN
jgi:cell division septal protein FtsQ